MEEQRKEIVIDEIRYWREHQLLPKEYCDFLLALYTQGEDEEETETKKKAFSLKSVLTSLSVIVLLSLLPGSFLVIYFTELSMLMQTGIISIFLLLAASGYLFFSRSNSIYVHIAIIVFLLMIFLFSVSITEEFIQSPVFFHSAIVLNCIVWTFLGLRKNIFYLIASGIIGFIMWLLFIFF